MAEEEYVGTGVDDMVEGGGRLDDVDATVNKARWEIFNYQGKGAPSTGLRLYVTHDDGTKGDEFLRCATPEQLVPAKDGLRLKRPPGSKASLVMTTKAGRFLTSLANFGFEGDIGGDIDCLDGHRFHFVQEKRKKRDPADKDSFDTLVNKVYEEGSGPAPAEEKKAGKGKATKAKGKGFDLKGAATELVMAIAKAAEEDGVSRGEIATKVFRRANRDPELKPHAKELSKLVNEDDYLADDDAPFGFDGDTIFHPDFMEEE